MKKLTFILLFVATLSLASCGMGQKKDMKEIIKTPLISMINTTDATFTKLTIPVDSISASLSAVEQERAAFFLVSAYSLVMQAYVERGNPAEPMITDWMTPPRKFGGDNPYTIYSQVPVDAKYAYKLSGTRGSYIYLGVQLYGFANGFNLPTQNIGNKNIKFNKDGSFDIYISKERPKEAKNWVQMADGDHAFLVRQYFDKRVGNVPAKLSVVRIDKNTEPGPDYMQRLESANRMMTECIMGTIDISSLLSETATNQYAPKDGKVRTPKYGGALYPTKDNVYEGCWVSLKQGQAMKVHGRLPKNTLYASYVFYDRWYNTPSYPEVNCFRTMNEIALNPDGTFDLYISPEIIEHPNWLNTGGLYEGSFSSRYLESTEKEFPTVEIVKIKDIPVYRKK